MIDTTEADRARAATHYGVPAGLHQFITGTSHAEMMAHAKRLAETFPQACAPPAFADNPGQGMGSDTTPNPLAGYGQYYDEQGRLRR